MRTVVWHTKYHSKMVTFLSPFSGRKQLLPFHCQQGWLMEVEWSAFHHSKWESILGNGRNTHLHLSLVYRRAVTVPEWMATYRAWQKNTKCLKVLTCAKVSVQGKKCQWPKEPPPGNRQPPLCEEYPVKLHLATSKTELAVSQVSISGGQVECKLFFWLWPCPFVFPSNLLLPSPPGVCLVSLSVRLVSLHAGRQPVSLSSF